MVAVPIEKHSCIGSELPNSYRVSWRPVAYYRSVNLDGVHSASQTAKAGSRINKILHRSKLSLKQRYRQLVRVWYLLKELNSLAWKRLYEVRLINPTVRSSVSFDQQTVKGAPVKVGSAYIAIATGQVFTFAFKCKNLARGGTQGQAVKKAR